VSIAAFPLYDLPEIREAHDALWSAIAIDLTSEGIKDVPALLKRDLDHFDSWRHPGLLLGQGCEYPLATQFSGFVRVVAHPVYQAAGCVGATYRSAIVVRNSDPARTLEDMRNSQCAINEANSNSGMNFLREAIAPLAHKGRFFRAVHVSGSHRKSIEMVVAGAADLAAIDCVTLSLFKQHRSSLVAPLRVLCWTNSSPSLPYITARSTSDTVVEKLRSALAKVIREPSLSKIRHELLLEDFEFTPVETFDRVLQIARNAADQGYPELR
jgi:ABC-type phosphate/phosphonate transport system substrate-binding protein